MNTRMGPQPNVRDVPPYLQHLWELMWRADGYDVPFCTRMPVERDNTLSDDVVLDGDMVPSSCWVMKIPENIGKWMNRSVSGILIRHDYIEALRDLFEAAGMNNSHIRDLWTAQSFTNPFLNVAMAHDQEGQGGFILTGHPGIGTAYFVIQDRKLIKL